MIVKTGLFAAALLAATLPAGAATLVDTGTPPPSDAVWTLSPSQSLAAKFSVGTATVIDTVLGHIRSTNGGSTITIALHADGGDIPSAILYSASFASTAGTLFQGVTNQSWTVAQGSYWVSFASNANDGMGQFAPAELLDEAFAPGGSAFIGFDDLGLGVIINGDAVNAVPEPATWAMMVAGFALTGMAVRRRRRITVRFA